MSPDEEGLITIAGERADASRSGMKKISALEQMSRTTK
jgi:hypothetical protein